jgi:thioredoxin
MENIVNVKGKDELSKTIKSADKLLIVDFWAPWCGPCKMLIPTLENLAEERDDITLVKVNVEEEGNQDIAITYGVRGIPAVFFVKDGEQVDKFAGNQPRAKVEELIEKNK